MASMPATLSRSEQVLDLLGGEPSQLRQVVRCGIDVLGVHVYGDDLRERNRDVRRDAALTDQDDPAPGTTQELRRAAGSGLERVVLGFLRLVGGDDLLEVVHLTRREVPGETVERGRLVDPAHFSVFLRPRGARGRESLALSTSSSRASRTHEPSTSMSGRMSRSAVMP